MPLPRQFERPVAEFGRNGIERFGKIERQCLAPQLLDQRVLLFDEDQLAARDDADAVGHFFGLFDIMGGQNDRHPALAQAPHHIPHVAAQFDVDPRGRFVKEEDFGFVAQRLGDHHAAFHAARQFHDLAATLVPQRQILQQLLDERRIARFAEQPARESDGGHHRFERIRVQFLRHQPDHRSRRAIIASMVVATHRHRAFARRDDPADDADQRRLARPIGTQQSEYLALLDAKVDTRQGAMPALVSLSQTGNFQNRCHARRSSRGARRDKAAKMT
jgi:hypothetical protein